MQELHIGSNRYIVASSRADSDIMMNSERGEGIDEETDGDELHDLTPVNDTETPVQMEECKNGRFKRVFLFLLFL